MVHVCCPACDRLISLPPDMRVPPWCPHCGQNLNASELKVLRPAVAPSAAMGLIVPALLPDGALDKWNPAAPPATPRGVETIRTQEVSEEPASLPKLDSSGREEPTPATGWTCQACGCEFAPRRGVADAHADWLKAMTGVPMPSGPCPGCRSHHPALLPAVRVVAHATLAALTAFLLLLVGCTSLGVSSPLVGGGLWAMLGFGVVCLLLHALAVWYEFDEKKGEARYEILSKPTADRPACADARPVATLGAWGALGLVAVGTLAMPAAEVVRMYAGWPYSPSASRGILAPGDKVRVTLPSRILSADGRWKAEGSAGIHDPNERERILFPVEVKPEGKPWGPVIKTKSFGDIPTALDCELTLPNDPRLEGRRWDVRVRLSVTHPVGTGSIPGFGRTAGQRSFVEKVDSIDEVVTLEIGSPAARSSYTLLGTIGGLGGLVLCLAGGAILTRIAWAQVGSFGANVESETLRRGQSRKETSVGSRPVASEVY